MNTQIVHAKSNDIYWKRRDSTIEMNLTADEHDAK